ncbi:MAG: hypothetical protein QM736_21760 [Vicinamibacterales bacterium]
MPVRFYFGTATLRTMYLSQVCRPQHLAFICGVVCYAVAKTSPESTVAVGPYALWVVPIVVTGVFTLVGIRCHRRGIK